MPEEIVVANSQEQAYNPPAAETPAESVPNAQNAADQATADLPGETPPETPEQAAKRQGRRFERKLDKAFRRAAEAEARAKFFEGELQKVVPQTPKDTGAPRLEDFSDIEDFRKAVEKHVSEKTVKELDAKRAAESNQQQQHRLTSEWEKRVTAAESKYDDFDEVVGEIKPTSALFLAVMEADNGPDIAYYLGTHMDEATAIAHLSPSAQIRAIGRLEAKLAAEPPKPKTPSNAPAPIKTVGGSSAPSTKKMSDMTQDEFEKKRRAYIAGRR